MVVQPPGWGPSSEYLRATLLPLLRGFRLLTYDVRNTGRGPRVPGPESQATERLVEDLHRVTDEVGWSRFALLGHSHGATVAAAYAAVHPERVRRLVLLTPSLRGRRIGPEARTILQRWLEEPERRSAARAYLDGPGEIDGDLELARWMRRVLPALFGDLERMPELVRVARHAPPPSATAYRGCPPSPEPWVVRALEGVRAPTLVLAGELDVAAPPEEAGEVAEAIPGAELVVLSDCGHHPWVERPREVGSTVRRFLRGSGTSPHGGA